MKSESSRSRLDVTLCSWYDRARPCVVVLVSSRRAASIKVERGNKRACLRDDLAPHYVRALSLGLIMFYAGHNRYHSSFFVEHRAPGYRG